MTTAPGIEINEASAPETQNDPAKYESLNPFRAGPGPLERADGESRAALEKAELAAEEARAAVESERNELIARQTRLEALTAKRNVVAARLSNLEGRDLDAERAACVGSIERFLGSHEAANPIRAIELNSATRALAEIRELKALLPGIIKTVKAELKRVETELAALEGK